MEIRNKNLGFGSVLVKFNTLSAIENLPQQNKKGILNAFTKNVNFISVPEYGNITQGVKSRAGHKLEVTINHKTKELGANYSNTCPKKEEAFLRKLTRLFGNNAVQIEKVSPDEASKKWVRLNDDVLALNKLA